MGNIEKMTIEQWESKYKPIVNPNAEDEYSADRFETCGEDLDFVLNVANTTPKKVWTLEDIDGQLIICAGYHLVNRINYFVTEIEWEDEDIQVQYCDEDAEINESAIQKALKDMLDHVMILNDNEKLSSDTLITMAVDALFEDEEYGSFVDKNSERAYLQQIADALSKKGLTFYDTNVLDVEICSECGIVLLPDDECYESHKGEPLCAGCTFRCECCDQYFKKEEVRESINGYSCKSCELQDFMQKNILSEEEKDDLIAEIYSWHENCEHGQNGECEIFNAIEQGAEDDEVISIAFKVDRDLFDKFEKMPKYIESVSTEKVELDVYECTCGFHLGIDATYLEQVSEVSIVCPSCGNSILTTEHDGCNSDSLENKSKPFDANNYTSRQLLEMEFQNVPNSTHKDNLIAEALQLVEVNGYTVGEAANEVLAENTSFVGLPELFSIRDTFLTYVGEWTNGKECRTGENRANGTVTYNQDGLYLYEFKTREDAFKYLYDDNRSVPYAMAEYDERASEERGEECYGHFDFYNGFTKNDKKTQLLSLIFNMSVNGVNLIDISKEKNFEDIVDPHDATFQIFTQDGIITVDWGEGESGIDVYADSSVNEELVKAFRYQMFPFLTMDQVFDYFQSKK